MASCILLSALTAHNFASEGADNKLSVGCLMPLMWHAHLLEALPRHMIPRGAQPFAVYIPILVIFPVLYGGIFYWLSSLLFKQTKSRPANPTPPGTSAAEQPRVPDSGDG